MKKAFKHLAILFCWSALFWGGVFLVLTHSFGFSILDSGHWHALGTAWSRGWMIDTAREWSFVGILLSSPILYLAGAVAAIFIPLPKTVPFPRLTLRTPGRKKREPKRDTSQKQIPRVSASTPLPHTRTPVANVPPPSPSDGPSSPPLPTTEEPGEEDTIPHASEHDEHDLRVPEDPGDSEPSDFGSEDAADEMTGQERARLALSALGYQCVSNIEATGNAPVVSIVAAAAKEILVVHVDGADGSWRATDAIDNGGLRLWTEEAPREDEEWTARDWESPVWRAKGAFDAFRGVYGDRLAALGIRSFQALAIVDRGSVVNARQMTETWELDFDVLVGHCRLEPEDEDGIPRVHDLLPPADGRPSPDVLAFLRTLAI